MRRSASFLIPISLITLYYTFWIGLMIFLLDRFPVIYDYFPLGGLENLQMRSESDLSLLEPVDRKSVV